MKCVGTLDTSYNKLLYFTYDYKRNVAQVPQMKKWKDKDIDQRADELLNMVGLEPENLKIENLMNCQVDSDNV